MSPSKSVVNLDGVRKTKVANVFKGGLLAGTLRRTSSGVVEFRYDESYVSAGVPIAFSLPVTPEPVITPGGGVPAFFAGLLPEGYRLTSLRERLKVSASDELSLLLAVGADTPGDVQILPEGVSVSYADAVEAPVIVDEEGALDFSGLHSALDLHALPGVQDKVSSQMITAPVGGRLPQSILKLNPPRYPGLVENEFAHLNAASALGLPVASAKLLRDRHGEAGLLVRRFDRVDHGENGGVTRLALEDATQIMGLTPAQKYNVAAEEVVQALADHCAAGMVVRRNLFMQFLFAWLTGNGDLHAKNVALLQVGDRWQVSPIYDVPSTLVYGDTTMALDIDGRRNKLRWRNWMHFGESIGLPERAVLSAAKKAGDAAAGVDWEDLPFEGSPRNGALRELRFRRAQLPTA